MKTVVINLLGGSGLGDIMKTVVINLLGGSGLGKSTTAALIFGDLKLKGQGTLYGHQIERESALYGKVDYVVTDSPLLLCPIYQLHYSGHDSIKSQVLIDMATALAMGVVHLNFLLTRKKPFNPKGRYETEDQAKVIDGKIQSFLTNHQIPYITVDCADEDRVKLITQYAINYVNSTIGESDVAR